MKKNRAIWVALLVLAAAALLMIFVVLPQVRGNKTVDELAGKAGEVVKQAQETAQKAVEQVTADPKAAVLAKMARVKADGEAATVEFEALFADNRQPTTAEIQAARAKLQAALKSASEVTIPEGLDGATAALVSRTTAGARAALALIDAMPTDAASAKSAFASLKATFVAALNGEDAPKAAVEAAPAENTMAAKPAEAVDAMPSFDLLRVEPDGSTVIAGHAAPGAKVDIVDGDKVIATTNAGASGDFVAVLDSPLVAGDHQLGLLATGKDGKKTTSLEVGTVFVPADQSGELLAMVTKPGEASRIMTMPESRKEPLVVESADNAAAASTTTTDNAKTVAGNTDKSSVTPALPDASTEVSSASPDVQQEQAAAPNATSDATPAAVNDAAKPVEKAAVPEVLVSAVEIEGSKIFVAGSARPKALVRVYADDKLIAEVPTDQNGRFVADSTMPLTVGNHTIRADLLSGDGKKVEFRASVPFFRPEGEQLAAVAGDTLAQNDKSMQPLADGTYDKAREEAGKAISLLKELYASGRTPKLDELAAARSATEIALKTLSQIKLPDNVDPVARQMADSTAGRAAQALALLKSLPQDANAVKSALDSIDVAVTSAVASTMETAQADKLLAQTDKQVAQVQGGDVMDAGSGKLEQQQGDADVVTPSAPDNLQANEDSLVASNDADQPKVIEQAPLKASQTSVIIRRGDTLWQISRRVYGRGVRYTTIYIANEGQIADPDRIMPGQIFGVPDKYLDNAEELHRERLDHKKH